MSSCLRVLSAMLALVIAESAFGQPTADRVDKLAREFSFETSVQASGEPAPSTAPSPAAEGDAKRFHEFRMQQQKDKILFAALLGVIALLAHLIVLRFLQRVDRSAAHVLGATGLVYIVFGTIILVVIANTEAQLTASMGILGAIAGYLFGRFQKEEPEGETGSGKGQAR